MKLSQAALISFRYCCIYSEESREIQHAFKINDFPSAAFVKNGKVYKFALGNSPPTNQEMIDFIKGGYKNITATNIPAIPVDQMKYLKEGVHQISEGLDKMIKEDPWIIGKLLLCFLLIIALSIYLTEYVTKNYYTTKGDKSSELPVTPTKTKHPKSE